MSINIHSEIKWRSVLAVLFVLLIFGSFRPSIFYLAYLGLDLKFAGFVSSAFSGFSLIYLFIRKRSVMNLPKPEFIIPLSIFLFFIAFQQVLFGYTDFLNTWFGYFRGVVILTFVLQYFSLKTLLKSIIGVHIAFGIIGSIGVVLAMIGVLPLHHVFDNSDGAETGHFLLVHSKEFFRLGSGYFVRLSGMYDEPGTHAVVTLLLMLLNLKFFNNKKVESLLVLSTVLTLSLFFVLIVVLFYVLIAKNFNDIFRIIVVATCLACAALWINTLESSSSFSDLYTKTVGRIVKMNEGLDNTSRGRTLSQSEYVYNLKDYNQYFGEPRASLSQKIGEEFDRASLPALVIEYGYVGTAIYYSMLVWVFIEALIRKNRVDLISAMLIGISCFQRPDYLFIPYMFLFYFLFYIDDLNCNCYRKSYG